MGRKVEITGITWAPVAAAMRAVADSVAAWMPKKGTNSASFSPKSMSGSMK
ncbi:hypothetical protein D9M68_996400 [compost metagenome]